MLAAVLASFVLSLSAMPQAQMASAALPAAVRGVADAVAIRGTTELSPAEAFGAARTAALEHLRSRWNDRAQRLLVDARPFWLPELLAQHAASRWLAAESIEGTLRIVDREDRSREHEFGQSFQTTLWVTEDPKQVAHGERRLRRELAVVQRRTLVTAGVTVGCWALLGFVLSWLDRLSRGYMTGRLRLIGLLLGAALPTLAFLL